VGLLQTHEAKSDGSFVDRHAKGIANAKRHVRDCRLPVAVAEYLHGQRVEAIGFVPIEIIDEKLVAELTRHQPARASSGLDGFHITASVVLKI
jgi:hypothetical protein